MLSCGHNVCKEDCFKLEGKKCPCCRKICKYGAYNRELINLLEEGNQLVKEIKIQYEGKCKMLEKDFEIRLEQQKLEAFKEGEKKW